MTAPTTTTPPPPDVFAIKITPEFAAGLAAFQRDLPKIQKNRHVEVETAADKKDYDYSYATLDHISDIVMPKLAEHGLSFASFPGVGSGGRGLSVRYFLLHASGGYIGCEWPVPGSDQKGARLMQAIGGMVTYIRRYALQAATGVSAEDDDDDLRGAVAAEQQTPTAQRRQRSAAARTEQAQTNTARRRERPASEPEGPPADTSDAEPTSPAGPQGFSPPRDPDAPVSQPQQRKLIMQFKDLGKGEKAQREERLKIVSGIMGKPVGSITELTAGEAHELIEIVDSALATDNPLRTLFEVAQDVAARASGQGEAVLTEVGPEGDAAWSAELEQAKREAGTVE